MIIKVNYNGTLKEFNILDDSIIAEPFDSTETYAVGDICFYGNTLYKFTSAHTGAWASADVTAVTVCDELSNLKSDLNGKYSLPSGGIPSSDMASAVQTSLGKADAAIPAPSSPSSGQFLVYNGSAWVAQSLSTWQGGNY